MKIIFAGTPDFSTPTLKALIASRHDIVAVLTQPDKPKGRGQKKTMSPVKVLAVDNALPVFQPKSLKDDNIYNTLKSLHADLMVVVAYGLLLPESILALYPHRCINVHASLLPNYRGAAPIQAAILHGDNQTGITIMEMAKGLDTGDILYQAVTKVASSDTSQTLHDKLSLIGATSLMHTVSLIEKDELPRTPQDEALASHTSKIKKTHATIDWTDTAINIERKIRAYYVWPVAFSCLNTTLIRIWHAEVLNQLQPATPGELVQASKDGIRIACGEGDLLIKQLQFPGGKILSVKECLNAKANLFSVGTVLGS